jgi:hypothetical protein
MASPAFSPDGRALATTTEERETGGTLGGTRSASALPLPRTADDVCQEPTMTAAL